MRDVGDVDLCTWPRFRIRSCDDGLACYLLSNNAILFRSDRQPLLEPFDPFFHGLLLQVKGGELSWCRGLSFSCGVLWKSAPANLSLSLLAILWASLFPRHQQDWYATEVDSFSGDGLCISDADNEPRLKTIRQMYNPQKPSFTLYPRTPYTVP